MTRENESGTMCGRLAGHVHGLRFDDIPADVIDQTKHHLVHDLGLAFGGRFEERGRQAARLVEILSPHGGDCTVIGQARRAAAVDAAFANCTLMTGLDDVLFPGGIHAGLVTIPLALALGERERHSGREVLTAIVAAYDVMGKLSRPVWAWSATVPRRPTIAFGSFGAAAVSARLLGLDPGQTATALGYAAHSAMGLAVGALATHYYSLLARNGYMAALLAREGGVTSPVALEGRFGFFDTFFGGLPGGIDASLDTLGETFEMSSATTKHYPGTGLNIVPVQLMIDLTREHALTPDNVAKIRLDLPVERENFASGHAAPPFGDAASAASSVRFHLAVVLLEGGPRDERYQQFDNPEILEIVDRVEVRLVPGRPIRYARLQVTTVDGAECSAEGDTYVFPRAEWSSWLARDGARLVGADKIGRLAELIGRLDDLDDISEVLACTTPDE
ncbi:MAG TPA: MmgE/PrpD family protein [Streptosporangiaceae bacterium]|nr:MmgE/PrpD family protein [Streptosporangiaceae bacterium]